jgi:hypothetical protein
MAAILLFYSPQKYYLHKQLRTLPTSIAYAGLRILSDMLLPLRKQILAPDMVVLGLRSYGLSQTYAE